MNYIKENEQMSESQARHWRMLVLLVKLNRQDDLINRFILRLYQDEIEYAYRWKK